MFELDLPDLGIIESIKIEGREEASAGNTWFLSYLRIEDHKRNVFYPFVYDEKPGQEESESAATNTAIERALKTSELASVRNEKVILERGARKRNDRSKRSSSSAFSSCSTTSSSSSSSSGSSLSSYSERGRRSRSSSEGRPNSGDPAMAFNLTLQVLQALG